MHVREVEEVGFKSTCLIYGDMCGASRLTGHNRGSPLARRIDIGRLMVDICSVRHTEIVKLLHVRVRILLFYLQNLQGSAGVLTIITLAS